MSCCIFFGEKSVDCLANVIDGRYAETCLSVAENEVDFITMSIYKIRESVKFQIFQTFGNLDDCFQPY